MLAGCDLVLGASGFVGRHVARALARRGRPVALLARNLAAVDALRGDYGLRGEAFALDVTDAAARAALFENLKPRRVYNLVGYGIDRSERDPALFQQLNAELPAALALELATYGTRGDGFGLVHVGSALEYGRAPRVHEDDEPEPFEPYGDSKLKGTNALLEAATTHGVPCVVARLFTVYGPGEHAKRLLPSLLEARHTRGPVALSAGTQRRDFTEVMEVAEALVEHSLVGPDPSIVNLATGQLSMVRDFVERAAPVLGIDNARLDFGALPTRPDEMQHAPVVTDRLKARIGRGLTVDIASGVQNTLDFFEGELS